MLVFLNIIVLILEILYYSLFMKYARNEGSFSKYVLLFILITFVGLIIGTEGLPSYLLLVIMILLGLKYVIKLKTSLYDMLVIVIMLFINIIIQLPVYIVFYRILHFGHFTTTLVFEICKLLFIILIKNRAHKLYKRLKSLWDNNNFYIRYIFSCLLYIYSILTVILLIKLQ